jgi:class 3 adenylate cyclase
MHRELRRLLHAATGRSEFVVALFLDVRGFSGFARLAESTETAAYLRSLYKRILDNHFQEAAFFKPTGDGLLIVLRYDEGILSETVNAAVRGALAVVANFPTICADDPMINFEVPKELGVGISRGAATALVSGRKTLDYSGRRLNLAARLRPSASPAASSIQPSTTIPVKCLMRPSTWGIASWRGASCNGNILR